MSALSRTRILGAGAVAASALAVAGCGAASSGASRSSAANVGSSAISRAADVSGAAQGEKVAYTYTETLPHLGPVTVTGTGAFNNSPAAGTMTAQVAAPNASGMGGMVASALSGQTLNMVLDDSSVYLQVPSSLSGFVASVTQGKPWVCADLSQLASSSRFSGLGALLNGQGDTMDPTQALSELKAASRSVTKVSTVTVNGVPTTQYRGSLDLAKISSELPASLRAAMKQRLAKAAGRIGHAQVPFTVDIDADNLVRQIAFHVTPTSPDGTKVPVAMTLDFLAYGQQAAPTVPSASETENLDGLISSWGQRAASASSGSGFSRAFGG